MQRYFFGLLIILMLGFVHPLFAGWVVVEESTDNFGNRSFQTTFIHQNLVRIDGNTSVNIMDLKKKQLCLIFPQHRSYWKGTAEELNRQTNDLIKQQFQSLLARAPQAQKDTLKKLIQALDYSANRDSANIRLPAIDIVNTGKKNMVNGFHTLEYEVRIDSILKERLWVTTDKTPYKELNVDDMLAFSRLINPQSLVSILSHSPVYVALLKNGMVVKSIDYHANGIRQTSQVKKIKQMDMDLTLFQPPAGYRHAEIAEIMTMDINTPLPGLKSGQDDQNSDVGLPQLPDIKK